MKRKLTTTGLTLMALACLHTVASAQATTGMAEVVQKAITQNPDITARLNTLKAAINETAVARGGYYPVVNLTGEVGRESNRITTLSPESRSYNRTGIALNATQMLWDGQATRKEVERLGHAETVRYFEFLSASEDTALDAAKAYLDVQRYRKLVQLAEDNYVQHKYISEQLQSKYKAGVGRGVDAEQSAARLALAESNLTTEVANLHDVSARFLRVVGEAPAKKLAMTAGLDRGLLPTNADHISQSLARNASISAAIENMRAVEAQADSKKSPFQPKVEARLRSGVGDNFDGTQYQKRDTTAQIVLNWNLYNGGSDQARVKQYADLINQAADLRDKACQDVRQTSAIAYNDIYKLRDQLAVLDRNVLAIQKARDAYRQQFDIGQRSLLDLLNSENELYTAQRAYTNAEYDLQLAYARTQASRNTLTANLGISRDDGYSELAKDWQAAPEAAQRCPATAIDVGAASRDELNARAVKESAALVAPVAAPTPVAAATPAKADAAAAATVTQRLRDWAAAWMAKDTDRYFSFYAKEFAPARSTSAKWITERRRLVTKEGTIDVKVEDIKSTPNGDAVVTAFTQTYTSNNFKDKTLKTLTWKQQNGQWVIVKESNR